MGKEHSDYKRKDADKNRSFWDKQNSISNLSPSNTNQYEDNVNPSLPNRSSEDDELEEEIGSGHHHQNYIEKNDLEKTDQDFRDGDNQYGEDQDESDELRNGK